MFGAVGQKDVAVDLGTTNTLIYVDGQGIVLDEPSIVARDKASKEPIAIGTEAKFMMGRTPANIEVMRPLSDGVITDFEACEQMLRYFIAKALPGRRMGKPRMVICVPSGISGVEHRSVRDAAEFAGARESVIVEEPVAAAIGAGLPIHHAAGNLVIDIGGGTTEVAVLSLGGVVASRSEKVGGLLMDKAIVDYARKEYNLALGERTAEEIKIKLGSACPMPTEFEAEIRGRDLITGLPKTVVTTTSEIREALDEVVSGIVDALKVTLDSTPPELAADCMDRGITLVGGGSLLAGMDRRLHIETGMPIRTVKNPLEVVVLGSAKFLASYDSLQALAAGKG
ncbi:MAG: rod shape-determining protein [Acidimicrobiales bacterium]|nr:rod shape-determining protein [Acidimicrobiales bacterium]